MNKTIKKIALILVIIILLPAIFLTLNELTSYNENEKVLENIYADQLEAILFSVNQYSEDVTGSWATKVDDFSVTVDGSLLIFTTMVSEMPFHEPRLSVTRIDVQNSVNKYLGNLPTFFRNRSCCV